MKNQKKRPKGVRVSFFSYLRALNMEYAKKININFKNRKKINGYAGEN